VYGVYYISPLRLCTFLVVYVVYWQVKSMLSCAFVNLVSYIQ